MKFVPYDEFKDVEFITEGGFSRIYKATWINGPEMTVALKELAGSKNITSEHLNELKISNDFVSSCEYPSHLNFNDYNKIITFHGITQCPITQNFLIITKYYKSGSLAQYIAKNFFNMNWDSKLYILNDIIFGLKTIHDADIIHKDYHSGNIFIDIDDDLLSAITGDLGLSKSSLDDEKDDKVYGNIPYVAPEIFQGKMYTKASDIYSIGMIMWELMAGRKPFWNRDHDVELIIDIFDGLRPPIIADAPNGYVDLMKKCWHSNPNERPTAAELQKNIEYILVNEPCCKTKIMKSLDIEPITIHSSCSKNSTISSMTTRSSESEINTVIHYDDADYITKEIEFDIEISQYDDMNQYIVLTIICIYNIFTVFSLCI
ncbi:hypothetical protein RclHR1_00340027 [Rhizophagus clarus]|nr:hypothetical protein RclHR1_00340027 [Rhizophagus clarus]